MKPRKNYRMRPKKSGAKKRQRVLSQKKRLTAAGYERKKIDRMTVVEIREELKKSAKKKTSKAVPAKKVSSSKK